MSAGVFFNGRRIVTPTTASVVNDDAMRPQGLSVGNVVAIIGRSSGGEPKKALRFGNPTDAAKALGSGDGVDAVLAAFDPSSEVSGPSEVVFIRVNPATQSTGVLSDSTPAPVIDLKSTDYGLNTTQIKFKVEAGTVSGKRLTTQIGDDYYSQDNVGSGAFSVVYTGAAATATIAVTGTTVVIEAPAATVVATIDLTTVATVSDLVDRINVLPGFAAAIVDNSGSLVPLNGLDFVTAQSVKTAAFTVRADLQACISWFNSAGEGYITATRRAGAGRPPAATPWTFLTGGTDGVTTITDWTDAYGVLQSVDAQWITPATGDPAVHAMADAHMVYMSQVGRKERRSICGTVAGTSDASALAAAKVLNSDRTSLCFQGHYDYRNGALVLLAPFITAAKVAGAFAGVNPGTPLTNKSVKIRGLEREVRVPTDTDVLIAGGLLCIENNGVNFKVVQSISTWLNNNNYNKVEQSCGAAVDFTIRNVREALEPLRGAKNSPILMSRALSLTESTLRELAKDEPVGPGVLVGNDESPAYKNITATIVGDVLSVQFEASPVLPNNYILISMFAVPFTGTATA